MKINFTDAHTEQFITSIEMEEVPQRNSIIKIDGVSYRSLGMRYILAVKHLEYGVLVEKILTNEK